MVDFEWVEEGSRTCSKSYGASARTLILDSGFCQTDSISAQLFHVALMFLSVPSYPIESL